MNNLQLSFKEDVDILSDSRWQHKDMRDCNPLTHFIVIGVSLNANNLEEELVIYTPQGSNRILHRTKEDFLNRFREL